MGFLVSSSVGGTWAYTGGGSQCGGGWARGIRFSGDSANVVEMTGRHHMHLCTGAGFMGVRPVPCSLSSMLCCHYLEVLNSFIFELVLFKESPYAHRMCVSGGGSTTGTPTVS